MGAGERAVFDYRHARGVADRQFRQRARLENRGHVDRPSGSGADGGRKGAVGGERRGGKDGGDGKPAKRGEGQVKLLGGEVGAADIALKGR